MQDNQTINSNNSSHPKAKNDASGLVDNFELETGRLGKVLKRETSRWPALLALMVIGGAYAVLSERLTGGLGWLLLPVLVLLAVPAIISRLKNYHQLNHYFLMAICAVVTLAEVISTSLLILTLAAKSVSAVSLLRDAALLWACNVVVFALWYWQLDAGGPYKRSQHSCQDYYQKAELLFPQLTLLEARPDLAEWRPDFIAYLFVAFTTSTAFSPSDTPVLSGRIKFLSMLQAVLSLVTLATLAARAINIL